MKNSLILISIGTLFIVLIIFGPNHVKHNFDYKIELLQKDSIYIYHRDGRDTIVHADNLCDYTKWISR